MNTFERHFADFPAFMSGILSWHPDYLVPVAKKACKLIKTVELHAPGLDTDAILRYRTFFQLSGAPLKGKKVAVVDDAAQFTSTLSEYRQYFENQGAVVRTFSFVGHDDLSAGKRPKEDHLAEIAKFLPGPVYNEYILQQSSHLLNSGCHFDLDHLVFEAPLPGQSYEDLISCLQTKGTLLFIPDDSRDSSIERFSLHYPTFFDRVPYFTSEDISLGPIVKLKFAYDKNAGKLFFSPLIFPNWQYRNTRTAASLITNIPFKLPFSLPDQLDQRDRASVLRTYYNLSFIAPVSLAKAFIDSVREESSFTDKVRLIPSDLSALLGTPDAIKLTRSTTNFLVSAPIAGFSTGQRQLPKGPARPSRAKFSTFAQIYDTLRAGYEAATATRSTRVGAHFVISYEKLFKSYSDPIQLSEKLDYFCDLGAIVPEQIFNRNEVSRGCRTGETTPDPSWVRTDALIGLTIKLLCDAFKEKAVDPTLLNKVLATFAYDYPRQDYTQLHCIEATPYYFGSFIKVRHPLRAPEPKNLYALGQNAEFFEWNPVRKQFRPKNQNHLVSQVVSLFDQRQQAGYTELLNYLKMLAAIARRSKTIDVMNLLSICRDQDVFYAHLEFNLRTSFAFFLDHHHGGTEAVTEALDSARDNAESASTKCTLAREAPRLIEEIYTNYTKSLDYALAAKRLRANYSPFDSGFQNLLAQAGEIVQAQLLLIYLAYWSINPELKTFERLVHCGIDAELERRGKTGMTRTETLRSPSERADLIKGLIERITAMLNSLPRPKDTFRSRQVNASRESAKSQAIYYISSGGFLEGVIVHIDLTGMREILDSEALEEILGYYYLIVKERASSRSGKILYGGTNGDDAFDIFFGDIAPSLRCVEEIKEDFAANVFLNNGLYDVKFGLAWEDFTGSNRGQKVIRTWGAAKDCCLFKSLAFVNRGDLLISASTNRAISKRLGASGDALFVELPVARLPSGESLYRYSKVSPLRPAALASTSER